MKRFFSRICFAALFLLTLLPVCFIVWRVNLAHDVNAKLAAIRASGLPTSGAELNTYYPAVPDNENAALVMTQAFALMRNYPDNRSNEVDQFQFPTRGQRLTNEQIQFLAGFVEMNSNALAKMIEALRLPGSRYPVDFSPGFYTPLPHLGEIKRLARISEYQGLLAIDSTHSANADGSILNILDMAGTLNGEPTLISQLVRMALVNIANTTLEQRLILGGTAASMLDPNTGNWIISGGKLPAACNASAGVYAPCIPSNAINAAHVSAAANPNLGPDPIYTNFGPRFGFAYKVGNSTVVSGGYGMIYDNVTGGIQSIRDRLFSWPYNSRQNPVFNSLGNPIQTMSSIVPGLGTINSLPSSPTPFSGLGWYYDPHLKNHYSHQWNVEVQKELTSSLVASVSYVGSVDRHLPITGKDNNSPEPGGAGLDRPFPWAQTALEGTSRGTSSFNAMEARVNKHIANGISFGTGLTWSKSMDNGAGGLYGAETGPQGMADFQIYNDVNANRGESADSLKFIYYGWGIAELPFGKGKAYLTHGVGNWVLGGWQVNTNISAHSGAPLGMNAFGVNLANIGDTLWFFGGIRANQSGSAKVAHPTKSEWFNPAVFSAPSGSYGNCGRVSAFAPAFDQIDFSLMKGFKIGERVNIQFRPEFLNAFNIQNYGIPNTGVGAGMGTITGLASGAFPRQIQLSVKGTF